ncbi:AMP-binding protein [Rhodocyclus tenuis]|uniref:AMP-binding protein n=1 Tax=Rhodocyclus tenuis TaxID=1066 RepID=UPI0019080FB9|nr:AMP-binding protein [Rhodocyclus tenuis]MBK1680474.1 long-chain-fatty-acid--CoA ligase [Rhodocyclus tenuis]
MEKIWLKNYPAGIAPEVDTAAYTSVDDVFTQSCRRYAARPAFSSMGTTLSYAEIDRRSRDFAAFLQQRCALHKGERIAIMLPNVLQYPVAVFGAFRAGLIVVNCNPLYTPRELEHQLIDSGATAIVVLENFAHTLQQVIAHTPVRTVISSQLGDFFPPLKRFAVDFALRHVKKMVPRWQIAGALTMNAALADGAALPLDPITLTRDDIAFLQYTGGTTGVPKGAMLSHGNMVANLQQISAWIGGEFREGVEVVVTPLPLYHVFALTANLLTFIRWGALNVLIANPRDIPTLVAELGRTPFTAITGVNTLFAALLRDPGFAKIDTRALKMAFGGGMPVQRAVSEQWQATTGSPLIEGYGLTECSPLVAGNTLDDRGYTGTVGLPFPSTEVRICDEHDVELPLGSTGEIHVRGPQVMQGYWQQPAESEHVFAADGWLRTGDMGFMDADGRIKLTDRKKDMIVVSGFKVFPNEVEEVVLSHPGVLEVAAVAAPDERAGEVVMIVVVRRDPALTAEELIALCREQLTGYKVPRHVRFRDTPLPKSTVGKILRRLALKESAGEIASAGAGGTPASD